MKLAIGIEIDTNKLKTAIALFVTGMIFKKPVMDKLKDTKKKLVDGAVSNVKKKLNIISPSKPCEHKEATEEVKHEGRYPWNDSSDYVYTFYSATEVINVLDKAKKKICETGHISIAQLRNIMGCKHVGYSDVNEGWLSLDKARIIVDGKLYKLVLPTPSDISYLF